MKQNIRNERQRKGGKQKEQFEYFHLQNDEFDPYAIVVLNQLWISGSMWGLGKWKKKIKKMKLSNSKGPQMDDEYILENKALFANVTFIE